MTEDKLKQAIHQAIEQATVKVFGGLNGTGFFITADGYVLTAYHCIRSKRDIEEGYFPKKIRVQLISGEMLEAQLDQEKSVQNSDIAVLKVNYAPESCLPLGTEAKIHDDVVALGYPAAYLYESSPLGVYSGKISRFPTDTLIETDAVKGKGHSGSALYHYASKRVIGVLSEVYEPQVMTNAGLVVRLEPLFAKWPELKNITEQVAKEWEAKPAIATLSYRSTPSNIPHSGAARFVGREQELNILHEQLQATSRLVISAIAGMGGIGKTELAIQYALLHKTDYVGGICWLPASAQDLNLGIQITEFAKSRLNLQFPDNLKKVEDQVGFCWQHWPLGEVLVVLDNVTHYEEVKSYLPSAAESRFKVLITTRQQMGQPIKQLDLDVLDEAASLALLEAHLGKERLQAELEMAKKLCAWLGFLPLGLELVGRYLAVKEDLSLAQMQQRLEKKRLQQVALVEPTSEMTAQRGVVAAFELSWEELDEKAQQLGCLLSLFAPAPIRWELAEQVLSKQDPEDLETVRDEQLRQLHLLQRKGQGIYQLHTLVREFLRVKLEESPWAKELKQAFAKTMGIVSRQLFNSPKKELFENLVIDVFHLEEIAQNLTAELSAEDLAGSFIGIIFFYMFRGLPARAELWCQQWLSVAKKCFKGYDLLFSKLFAQFFLGILCQIQGKFTTAESYFSEVEKIFSYIAGNPKDSSEIDSFRAFLYSLIFSAKHQYSELESLVARSKPMFAIFGGSETLLLCNLAVGYTEQGCFDEAENTLQQALKVLQNSPDYLHVFQSLVILSEVYFKQKRYCEAENLLRQSLELSQRLVGNNNIFVGRTMTKLGLTCQLQNRYKEAESFYQQALELSKHLVGNSDISLVENGNYRDDIAGNLRRLANIYYLQGNHDKAVDFLHKEMDFQLQTRIAKEQQLDNFLDSLETWVIISHINPFFGGFQGESNNFHLLQLEKILETKKRLLGDNHLSVAKTLSNLVNIYYSQDRLEEAMSISNNIFLSLKSYEKTDDVPLVNFILNLINLIIRLGLTYQSHGRYLEAENLYRKCLETIKTQKCLQNEENVDVGSTKGTVLNNLGTVYRDQKRYQEAEPLFLGSLELCQKLLKDDDPDLARVMDNLGMVYFAQGRYSEAESLYKQALAIFEKTLKTDDPRLIRCRDNLSSLPATI